jgi:hypothetical protein
MKNKPTHLTRWSWLIGFGVVVGVLIFSQPKPPVQTPPPMRVKIPSMPHEPAKIQADPGVNGVHRRGPVGNDLTGGSAWSPRTVWWQSPPLKDGFSANSLEPIQGAHDDRESFVDQRGRVSG